MMHRMLNRSPALLSRSNIVNYEVNNNVAIFRINDKSSKVNTFNDQMKKELHTCYVKASSDAEVQAMVLLSGKPDCFIAGADIKWLSACQTASEATHISKEGQKHFEQIEKSTKPVVAAIMGSCLGGGFEAALACHYRVAVAHPKTQFSFPEVMLGILPGAGGTQRIMQKCAGIDKALELMLTGKSLNAAQAKRLGIVDAVIPVLGPGVKDATENTMDYLEEVACKIAREMTIGKGKSKSVKKTVVQKFMDFLVAYDWGRRLILNKVRKTLLKTTKGLYPAPERIVDIVEGSLKKGSFFGYSLESKYFGELAMSKESRALFNLYFGRTECRKNKFGDPERPIERVAVLGSGLMGAGIAEVTVNQAHIPCIMKDLDWKNLAQGEEQISKNLSKKVKRKKLTSFQRDQILSELMPTLSYGDLRQTDCVIEAVFEDLDLKRRILKELEEHIPAHCIIATNTSALPIHKVAAESKRPERIIGMHYFSPVDKMQLLEVIATDKTSKATCAAAVNLGLRQNKIVISVKDGPGFYTTRILAPMLAEAIQLLQEGVSPRELDSATTSFGWPVGLASLADEVGLDIAYHVSHDLQEALGDRLKGGDVNFLKALISKKIYGKKTKSGLFTYGSSGRADSAEFAAVQKNFMIEPRMNNDVACIQHRLFSRFVNEAVLCLQEGIIDSPSEGDIGAVFGLGFPPFKGGPFHYLDNGGATEVCKNLEQYAERFGPHLLPCDLLKEHALDTSKKFYAAK